MPKRFNRGHRPEPAEGTDPLELHGRRPRPGLFLLLCFLGVLFLLSLFGDRSLLQLYQMWSVETHLEQQIEALKQENALLRQEVEALRRHPSQSEEVARRDLGLVRPGETVYQFRKR
ncbi:MAG: FtsB family cell division protein [Candidatus Methylomirabilales bacterium]